MKTQALVYKTGAAIKADPAASMRVLLFFLLAILVILAAFKFMKGLGKVSDLISEAGPSTEAEKNEVISSPVYQDSVSWLNDQKGIQAIVRAGNKNVTQYLQKKNFPYSGITKAAEQIWQAKMPFYISSTEVYNAIASLPSRAAVSIMAGVFNYVYKDRVGFYPLNVFLGKYLKLKEMQTLTQLINKKPVL